jgi:hypothetical protein
MGHLTRQLAPLHQTDGIGVPANPSMTAGVQNQEKPPWLNELFVRTRTALPIQLGTRGGFAAENNCFGQMQVTVCGLRWLLTHMGSDNSDSRPILAPTQSQ